MRTLALQSALVAALAVGAASAPVDDNAQTNSQASIIIPVLINDGGGQTLLSVGPADSGVATVSIVGDEVRYSPNGFFGNDSFTYTTDCGTASVVVAVTPLTPIQTDAPRDDFASTRPATVVNIPVLANDPQGSRMTSIVAPGPANGTAVIDENPPPDILTGSREAPGIIYTPDPLFIGTDTFEYTTQGGTARVTVVVSDTAATPVGAPVADADQTDVNVPIVIRVLENDPPGSQLMRVNNFVVSPLTGNTQRTIGLVQMLGDKVFYTPDPNLQITGDVDVFSYETQNGTAIVTVTIGRPAGAGTLGQVILDNQSSFNVRFTILNPSPPASFFNNCDNSLPRGFIDVGLGNMQPTGMTTLCVGLGQSASGVVGVQFQAEIQGNSVPQQFEIATQTCNVAPLPAGPVTVTIIDRVQNVAPVGQPPVFQAIGIQFGACP